MFKALILQAQHNLSDARMGFMIRDRLYWMRFLGFDLGAPTPDENTIRLFRNKLTETGTLKQVMKAFDWQLKKKGYIPALSDWTQSLARQRMSRQIVDASPVPAPKQRDTEEEKAAIKAGKAADEIWPDEPNKAAQKDTNARWTLKIGGKVRHRPDGTPLPMIAIPKAVKKAKGNSSPSKGCSAKLDMASSISTAFIILAVPQAKPIKTNL